MSREVVEAARAKSIEAGLVCPACHSSREKDSDKFKCGSSYDRGELVRSALCEDRSGRMREA